MRSITEVLGTMEKSIVVKAKEFAPFKTGRLKRSIKGTVKKNKISISMLDYGKKLDMYGYHKGWFTTIVNESLSKNKKALIEAFKQNIIKNVKTPNTKRLSGIRV